MSVDFDGSCEQCIWWMLDYGLCLDECELMFDDWQECVFDGFCEVVVICQCVVCEVGVLFFGGVDLSLLVGLLYEVGVDNLLIFFIGFEDVGGECGDEFQYFDLIVECYYICYYCLCIGEYEVIEQLLVVFCVMSELMVSYDCIVFYLFVWEVLKYCKVVQSGQGVDELFVGYYWYLKVDGVDDVFVVYCVVFFDCDYEEYLVIVGECFCVEDVVGCFVCDYFVSFGVEVVVDKVLCLDSMIMLVDDLVKWVDNMIMVWGLEVCVLFFDYCLVELLVCIFVCFKFGDGGKQVFKGVVCKVIFSEVIDWFKGYFLVFGFKYLQGCICEWVCELLFDLSQDCGLFQLVIFDCLLSDLDGDFILLCGFKLWQLVVFNFWFSEQGF